MDSNMNTPEENTETILVYNQATGEIQIIVPRREDDKYLTTEKFIVLDKAEGKRLYLFLKNIFESQ